MQITKTDLDGVLIIEPRVFGDARGFFKETWSQKVFAEHGLNMNFKQDNLSFSKKGILRGLHFQNPNPQGKLVSVLRGAVFDVAVDLRRHSRTFGKWAGVELSAENHKMFYIPEGFAHGFLTLTDDVLFFYKCTELYSPKDEVSILWNDPALGIKWPLSDVSLSAKDSDAKRLSEIPKTKLFD